MEPRPVSRSRSTLVKWMGLGDANSAGFVHGGTVMYLCDEAAGVAAVRHCGGRGGAAAMGPGTFLLPGPVRELLTPEAPGNAARRAAMEIGGSGAPQKLPPARKGHT